MISFVTATCLPIVATWKNILGLVTSHPFLSRLPACLHNCGFEAHADVNAAKNIGAAVNQPEKSVKGHLAPNQV
jgi:hypothetical protein